MRADEMVLSGGNRALTMLSELPVPAPPTSVGIRDGLIYRWTT